MALDLLNPAAWPTQWNAPEWGRVAKFVVWIKVAGTRNSVVGRNCV